MQAWRHVVVLMWTISLGCSQTVLVGEQDPDDGGGEGDADGHAGPDGGADAAPDGDAAADATVGLTCQEVLDCMRACGADLACGVDCAESICDGSAEAYDALETCGLESCPAECTNLGAPACADCVATACPLQGYACVSADC